MDFSQVKKWTIPQGSVKQVSANGVVIWKGTWKFTIYLGNYVSSVKYTTNGGSSWTSITSNTTLELDSGVTLRVVAETYSSEPDTAMWHYTMYDYNFDTSWTEANDGGSVSVYRIAHATYNHYTLTLTARYGEWYDVDDPSGASSTLTFDELTYESTITILGQEQGYDRDNYGILVQTVEGTERIFVFDAPQDDNYYTYDFSSITAPSTTYGNTTVTANVRRIGKVVQVYFYYENGEWSDPATGGVVDANYGDVVSISGQTISFTNDYGTTTYTFTPYSDSYYYYYFDRITFTNNVDDQMILDDNTNEVWGYATRSPKPGTISITAGTGVSSVFLSTNSTATSGDPSGTSYPGGTTVYAFIVASSGYYSTSTYVGGGAQYDTGAIYRVGSTYVAGNGSFGTKSANANPTVTVAFSNATATLNGSSITSGTAYSVLYNSSPEIYVTSNSNYYISDYSASGATVAEAIPPITVNNSNAFTKYKFTYSNITASKTMSTTTVRYYSLQFVTDAIPYEGTITYSNGSTESVPVSVNGISKYYSGAINYSFTAYSPVVYNSTWGQVTTYGTLLNGQYPYGGPDDDRIIDTYTATPSTITVNTTSLGNNWFGSGTAYHKVIFSFNGSGSSNHRMSVSDQDSASAYLSGISYSTYVKSKQNSIERLISGNFLCITDYGDKFYLRTNTSGKGVAPAVAYVGDGGDSPEWNTFSYIEARTISVSYGVPDADYQPFWSGCPMEITYVDTSRVLQTLTINSSTTGVVYITVLGAFRVRYIGTIPSGYKPSFCKGYVSSSCQSDDWVTTMEWSPSSVADTSVTPNSYDRFACGLKRI